MKTAPVFGGIAGIMSSEGVDPDDPSQVPAISRKTREKSKLQDMYRRMLAASYDAQIGELPADKTIEDIFAGGDGWGKGDESGKHVNAWGYLKVDDDRSSVRTYTPKSPRQQQGQTRSRSTRMSGGRPITPSHESDEKSHDEEHQGQPNNEVDEFEAREDLRSWIIRPQS